MEMMVYGAMEAVNPVLVDVSQKLKSWRGDVKSYGGGSLQRWSYKELRCKCSTAVVMQRVTAVVLCGSGDAKNYGGGGRWGCKGLQEFRCKEEWRSTERWRFKEQSEQGAVVGRRRSENRSKETELEER
ncbi:unnamed protein product [Eruca vesicaria subsp. sativa]|uniref:Uncharacterized protein n=1 Tax=Eruca vesicaria subsp. sativa TaxID=29727 RepID=A0ABC8J1P4_ERUVS|nr:unnamed protein product [Eruca vesicaria subsp. sativa]